MEQTLTAASDDQKRRMSWGAKIGIAVAAVVGVLVVAVVFAPTTSKGANDTLYQAIEFYHAGVTNEQADADVDKVAAQATIPFSAAEKLVLAFVQARVPESAWVQGSVAQARLNKLESAGVIPKGN